MVSDDATASAHAANTPRKKNNRTYEARRNRADEKVKFTNAPGSSVLSLTSFPRRRIVRLLATTTGDPFSSTPVAPSSESSCRFIRWMSEPAGRPLAIPCSQRPVPYKQIGRRWPEHCKTAYFSFKDGATRSCLCHCIQLLTVDRVIHRRAVACGKTMAASH